MSFTFRVAPRAERQIREAAEWWVSNRADAPGMFVEEIHAAFSLLEQFPLAGEAVHGRIEDLRRVLLSGVQYHVYYVADIAAATIEVLALWHTSRGTKPRI